MLGTTRDLGFSARNLLEIHRMEKPLRDMWDYWRVDVSELSFESQRDSII